MSDNLITKPAIIVSGGQSGTDYGSLLGAKFLGIPTSGWMPKGFRTEDGPKPERAREFGLHEHKSAEYPPRTKENVSLADVTVIISVAGVPERGSTLTQKYCHQLKRPYIRFDIPSTTCPVDEYVGQCWLFLMTDTGCYDIVNFAGNRESISPGIEKWTQRFVRKLFGE